MPLPPLPPPPVCIYALYVLTSLNKLFLALFRLRSEVQDSSGPDVPREEHSQGQGRKPDLPCLKRRPRLGRAHQRRFVRRTSASWSPPDGRHQPPVDVRGWSDFHGVVELRISGSSGQSRYVVVYEKPKKNCLRLFNTLTEHVKTLKFPISHLFYASKCEITIFNV